MATGLLIIIITFIGTGILFIGMSIPLIKRKIPPNDAYGFRAQATFSSESVWYDINEYSARLMRSVGVVILTAVPVLLVLEIDETTFAMIMIGIILVGTIIMIARSFIHLKKLTKQ